MNESKKLRRFYIFPVLYALSVYLFPVFLLLWEISPYFSLTPLIFGIVNIVAAVRCCKPEYYNVMLNSAVLIRYSLIPFFVMGGILTIVILLFSLIPVPFMIFAAPILAFTLCVIGWLILAFGAPYAISYLRLSCKAGFRSSVLAVLHSVCQFFFFLDVLDIMFLTVREGKWRKLTLTIILLMAAAVIGLIALIFCAIVRAVF